MNPPTIRFTLVGQGKPLVLLHAFPLSRLIWKDLQPPPGHCLVLPDFPGFGESPLEPATTLEEAVRGLEISLQEKGITAPLALGGISMGGYWAFEYLRQFPSRVSRLLLISTRAGADKPEGRRNRLNMADKVLREGTEFLVAGMVPGLLGKTTLSDKPAVAHQVARWIRQTRPEAVALAQRAMAGRRDQTGLLPDLKPSTLILAGREDVLIPVSESEAMAQAVPGSRLEILERSGHLIPLEEPSRFQEILNRFLSNPD